jgi:two-component sensor histidine kinase
MKLRLSNHLILFGLICLAPVVLAGVVLGYRLASEERARLERQTVSQVDAFRHDIDAELRSLSGMLEALAAAPALDSGDLDSFRAQAETVAARIQAPIFLRGTDGRRLTNTEVIGRTAPVEGPLAPAVRQADLRAIEAGEPTVSDLFLGPTTGRSYIAVVVPVMRNGTARYLMSVAISTAQIAEKLRFEPGTQGRWLGAVVGSDLRLLARTRDPETYVGTSATGDALRKALSERTTGTLISRTLDGVDVFTAFERADLGWTVVVSAPLDDLHQPLRAVVIAFVSIVGAVLLITVVAAWTYGRMLGREVSTLLRNARALGQDAPMQPYGQHIEEVAEVQQALFDAQSKVEQLIAELNHRVKNTLTVIRVLARRSVGNRRDRDAVAARISALTIAHEALTETHWRGADFGKLALAIARSADAAVACTGPAVRLTPKAAVALAQVLQELVSNAVQHGALRERSGRVELSWTVDAGQLHVVWTERTPLKPQAPDHAAGFGMQVIELCVVRQLGGHLAIEAEAGGWTVSLGFPMSGELGLMAEAGEAPFEAAAQ